MKEPDWETATYRFELPVDGSQEPEYAHMGIEFGPFNDGDNWRGANLPDGWSVTEENLFRSYVLDNRGRRRIILHLKEQILMRPMRRFNFGRGKVKAPDTSVRFCLWDGNVSFPASRKVVFEETHTLPSRKQHKEVHENRIIVYQNLFEKRVRDFLNVKYPHWESYNGHWDDEKDNIEEDKNKENG